MFSKIWKKASTLSILFIFLSSSVVSFGVQAGDIDIVKSPQRIELSDNIVSKNEDFC